MSSSTNQAVAPATILNEAQWLQLNQVIAPLNSNQLNWVSGYLAGIAHAQGGAVAPAAAAPVAEAQNDASLTILYGSQTSNAKGVAEQYQAAAKAAGISASLVNMADYKAKNLKNETHVVVIVSTHGEGDAPDDAVELHEFLASKKAPKLNNLKYSVLGLGDSSYEFFCQTAKDFDERLAALGAKSVVARADCDVDYDSDVETWSEAVTSKFKDDFKSSSHVVAMPGLTRSAAAVAAASNQYSKKNPFAATLSESLKITGRDSVKDIRHIEISLEDSGIEYRPGDALGVWFLNDTALVQELLTLVGVDASATVSVKDESFDITTALVEKLELTQSYPGFVTAYAPVAQSEALDALMADKAKLREYLGERQIIDIIREFPAKLEAQQLVDCLRPLTPRLYSIASSQAEVEDEVHLTVALVEYEAHGHSHQGGASGFLSERLEEGAEVKVFVEKNDNFRLPEDPNTPVIMVGPGTGIAPFRAFMQEREAQEAEGKNWLFFGNPNFTQDFLYQTEWQRFLKDGLLTNISLAFSRDQENKIYVQQRLLENGAEVYQWLEEGAHFYVCGDANKMAKDVHDALVSIVQTHGNKSAKDAESYVTDLRRAKRYQKDVY